MFGMPFTFFDSLGYGLGKGFSLDNVNWMLVYDEGQVQVYCNYVQHKKNYSNEI